MILENNGLQWSLKNQNTNAINGGHFMKNEQQVNQWDKELEKLLKESGLEGSPIEVIHEKMKDELNSRLNIGLFGAPGVGKSTLMNKLAGENIADAGIKPGVLISELVWGENDSISFFDLPGFGGLPEDHSPEEYWGKYKIEDLDLLICMFDTKLRKNDEVFFFKKALENGLKVIFVRSKSDSLYDPKIEIQELKEQVKSEYIDKVFGEHHKLIFVSSKTNEGIDELQNEISNNLNSHMKDKYYRNAKGYSDSFLGFKRKASIKTILFYSSLSASVNLNPVTGITLDLPNTMAMVKALVKNFNLSKKRLQILEKEKTSSAKEYQFVINAITKTGTEALKNLAAREGTKEIIKKASSFTSVIGASIGFSVTYYFGMKTLAECVELARDLNEIELARKYSS